MSTTRDVWLAVYRDELVRRSQRQGATTSDEEVQDDAAKAADRASAAFEQRLKAGFGAELSECVQPKNIALEMKQAGEALEYAARELKNITGKGNQAGRVHTAAQRAKQVAEDVLA